MALATNEQIMAEDCRCENENRHIIIIINEFHRDASLKKTSGPLCVTCYTSVNAAVAARYNHQRLTMPRCVCEFLFIVRLFC